MTGDLRPIGHVESSLKSVGDAPRQGVEGGPEAWLVLDGVPEAAMADVRVGDELLVLRWLHEADRTVVTTHPRNDRARPLTGVFSTRSPDRPNPIGLHPVTVLAVDGPRLRVSDLEAIEGTPVLDLKPVLGRAPRSAPALATAPPSPRSLVR